MTRKKRLTQRMTKIIGFRRCSGIIRYQGKKITIQSLEGLRSLFE